MQRAPFKRIAATGLPSAFLTTGGGGDGGGGASTVGPRLMHAVNRHSFPALSEAFFRHINFPPSPPPLYLATIPLDHAA